MKYTYQVAVRNDQGQVLVLEKKVGAASDSVPCFPGGEYDNESKLTPDTVAAMLVRRIQNQVLQDTGLSVGGIHLGLSTLLGNGEVHGYTAFVTGGKLVRYLKGSGGDYLGASWVTPSLALLLRGLPAHMAELLRRVSWITP